MIKIEETEGKRYLMADYYMLDKSLDKIKYIIGIEKCDDTEILLDTGDKLAIDIAVKNVVILITCVIKDGNEFYPQVLLEEHYKMHHHLFFKLN